MTPERPTPRPLLGLLLLLALGAAGCAEPLVLSDFHNTLGVNWLVRPKRHRGVDFPAKVGTPVLAAARGRVITSYMKPRVGWVIVIHHQDFDRKTRYLHLKGSDLRVGDLVERGDVIGTVGLFEFSAGVEHVHLELYDLRRLEGGLEDPLDWSAGCYDPSANYPQDRLVLTHPIACKPRWSNAHRDVESQLNGAELQLEASAGLGARLSESVALRTRGLIYSDLHIARFQHFLGWDGSLGLDSRGDERSEARLMSGVGIGHPLYDLALLGGVGLSRWGQDVERGFELPVQLQLRIKQRRFWGHAWLRSTALFGAESRQEGSALTLFGSDEFSAGLGLRLPPLTELATTLSIEYMELVGDRQLVLGVGASFDTLF